MRPKLAHLIRGPSPSPRWRKRVHLRGRHADQQPHRADPRVQHLAWSHCHSHCCALSALALRRARARRERGWQPHASKFRRHACHCSGSLDTQSDGECQRLRCARRRQHVATASLRQCLPCADDASPWRRILKERHLLQVDSQAGCTGLTRRSHAHAHAVKAARGCGQERGRHDKAPVHRRETQTETETERARAVTGALVGETWEREERAQDPHPA